MKTQKIDTPLLTVAEAAKLLRVHPTTIYRMLRKCRIQAR